MPSRICVAGLGMALMLGSGCETTPAPAEGLVSAYSLGDRGRAVFDEVVVSLRLRGSNAPYQNLHIAVTAFVNPIRKSTGSPSEAEGIVQRCEARILVKLSQTLSGLGEKSLDDSEQLRQLVREQAQREVDEAMSRWQYGADYKVEVAVARLYWTDASVGHGQMRRWW